MSGGRDLGALFAPRTVLLVGATPDTLKWGGWVARSLGAATDRFDVRFVSRSGGELYGIPVSTSVAEVEGPIDLAVIVVPAAGVPEAVAQSLALDARALVIVSAGFGEVDDAGLAAQEAIVEQVRAAGAVLLGPNCLGLFDAASGLNVYGGIFPVGDVCLVSQSGNLALEVSLLLESVGLGISRFSSVGNQADLTVADMLRDAAEHEATRVVAAYVEAPADGADFAEALRETAAAKPTVLLLSGRSEGAQRAAKSHTGKLAAESRVIRAVARDAGAAVVDTPGALVDAVAALRTGRRLRGRRIAVIADGGGHGVVASDCVADAGLELAELSPATLAALEPNLGNAGPANPVDLAGAGEADMWNFHRLTASLLAADEVDGVVLSGYFGGYGDYNPQAADRELEIARALGAEAAASGKPFVVHSMLERSSTETIGVLRASGVPVWNRIDEAVAALGATLLPAPAARPEPGAVPSGCLEATPAYPEARALLAELGVAFPDGELARTPEEASAIAGRIGAPVAMKAVAAELLHKTDAGGVELGVVGGDAAASAHRAITGRVAAATGLALDGVWVEAMAASDGVDLVVGARRDRLFGPVILIGVGGVFVEVLDDVVVAPAPTDSRHLVELMRTLRAAPLLAGARGQRPVDVGAAAAIAVRLGDLLVRRPEIAEAEVNPLRVTADGALALDARIVVG